MISVSNIERFATRDGPGIRTTVFLKGCPLHCPWCANPETWTKDPVLMHRAERCVSCHTCEHRCEKQAVSFENGEFVLDRSRCDACGQCVRSCLPGALSVSGVWMEAEDILETVRKDRDYYEESGGGVTFSGGEPLFQPESLHLFQLAKAEGLHTALETTGVYPNHVLREAEDFIDLFLFDFKHVDSEKLYETTGAPMDLILENLTYLTSKRPEDVIIRVPVIPGFNEDAVEKIIAFVKPLGVRAIHLLPFHNLGKTKWHQLQRTYPYEAVPAMKAETLKQYEDDLVSVGGQT